MENVHLTVSGWCFNFIFQNGKTNSRSTPWLWSVFQWPRFLSWRSRFFFFFFFSCESFAWLSWIRLYLTHKAAHVMTVTDFFFFFILDYCNSLLNGLPSAQVNRSSSGSSEQMVLLESWRDKIKTERGSHSANLERTPLAASCRSSAVITSCCCLLCTDHFGDDDGTTRLYNPRTNKLLLSTFRNSFLHIRRPAVSDLLSQSPF